MLVFLIVLSFLLDGVLTNFLPFFQGDLSFLTPYFTIVVLFLAVPFFTRKKEIKNYYILAIVLGILYDLFYTNLLVVHAVLFAVLAFFFRKTWENMQINWITIPLLLILFIGFYHLLFIGLLLLFHSVQVSVLDFLYVWSHSILLNLLYGEMIYFAFSTWNKKYLRMSFH